MYYDKYTIERMCYTKDTYKHLEENAMKITKGIKPITNEDSQSASTTDLYVKALRSESIKPGKSFSGKKQAFEELISLGEKYVDVAGGYLEAETTETEGYFLYKTVSIFHVEKDNFMPEFWGKALSEHHEFSIAANDNVVEIFIHELFCELL